jgi:hypothetical protein
MNETIEPPNPPITTAKTINGANPEIEKLFVFLEF